MLDTSEGSTYSGTFSVGEKELSGELKFAGSDTNLYLHDNDFFIPNANEDRCIHGILHNRERVSLIQCNAMPLPASTWTGGENYESADIFPHYVLYGKQHLAPADPAVSSASFVVDDAETIFYDFDAFSYSLDPEKLIQGIVQANEERIERDIATGPHPIIAYFTGKRDIASAETVLGTVAARHNPIWEPFRSGPRGVSIRNRVTIEIRFKTPQVFERVIDAILPLLQFLQIIAGRQQNLEQLSILLAQGDTADRLHVYWSSPPRRGVKNREARGPQPADLPIAAAHTPAEFATVLAAWLARHGEWREARSRFSSVFAEGNEYGVDRLVAAANMFDILPASAVPQAVALSPGLLAAQATARKAFVELPTSTERDSVLSALGRLGTSSLKHKIRHRAAVLSEVQGSSLPKLTKVLDLAVDCRNHFVHGSPARADYAQHFFETVPFFTDALEFVFATSDLVEAGWDMAEWRERGTTMSHPFGAFAVSFDERLTALNGLLSSKDKI